MLELVKQPWHWAVAGILIGLTVPALLLIGNKKFGLSSSLRHVCAICIPADIPFFKYHWKKEMWNLFFVVGVLIGAFLATQFLSNPDAIVVSQATKTTLAQFGITDYSKLMPVQIFSIENIFTLKGIFFFVVGGFLVGFGTRYAGGCTSGHAIMGLSNLQLPSLIATCCFMAGGFFSANLLMPLIFKLF
ncbi:MAG: YeeE/YedE thiosulfate transporter family protein [Chitinophagaceae bacterium]